MQEKYELVEPEEIYDEDGEPIGNRNLFLEDMYKPGKVNFEIQAHPGHGRLDILYDQQIHKLQGILGDLDISFHKIGSIGIPGIYVAKKELDIQISVSEKDFAEVKRRLGSIVQEKHREKLWDNTYALYHTDYEILRDADDLAMGTPSFALMVDLDYVVTVTGSPRDIHYKKTRKLLETNREVQMRYNILKIEFQGKQYADYSRAKWQFWEELQPLVDAIEL